MSKRQSAVETTWSVAPALFDFLRVDEAFEGPESHASGIAYHRVDVHVVVYVSDGREPGVFTQFEVPHDGGMWRASLGSVYYEAGLGPRQDVPENASGARMVTRRLAQHAAALRRILSSCATDDLLRVIRLCHGR